MFVFKSCTEFSVFAFLSFVWKIVSICTLLFCIIKRKRLCLSLLLNCEWGFVRSCKVFNDCSFLRITDFNEIIVNPWKWKKQLSRDIKLGRKLWHGVAWQGVALRLTTHFFTWNRNGKKYKWPQEQLLPFMFCIIVSQANVNGFSRKLQIMRLYGVYDLSLWLEVHRILEGNREFYLLLLLFCNIWILFKRRVAECDSEKI